MKIKNGFTMKTIGCFTEYGEAPNQEQYEECVQDWNNEIWHAYELSELRALA